MKSGRLTSSLMMVRSLDVLSQVYFEPFRCNFLEHPTGPRPPLLALRPSPSAPLSSFSPAKTEIALPEGVQIFIDDVEDDEVKPADAPEKWLELGLSRLR